MVEGKHTLSYASLLLCTGPAGRPLRGLGHSRDIRTLVDIMNLSIPIQ